MSFVKFEFDSTSMEDLFDDENLLDKDDVKQNAIIKGKVVSFERGVQDPYILLALSYKSDGKILLSEFATEPRIGDEIEALVCHVEESTCLLVLSVRSLEKQRGWILLESSFSKNLPVYGKVKRKVPGGFLVDVASVLLFLPFTEFGYYPRVSKERGDSSLFSEDLLSFKILELDIRKKRGIVSRKKLQSEEKEVHWKTFSELHRQGSVITGKVTNIITFGIFVEADNVVGFVHYSNVTWVRSTLRQNEVSIGQNVSVRILEIDIENRRLSLGMKQVSGNPWENIEKHIKVGDIRTGKVTFIAKYGAFINLSESLEGLLHVSKISWMKNHLTMNSLLEVGEEVNVQVIAIDKEEKKISLSIRELLENPWIQIQKQYSPGDLLKGKVTRLFKSGIFLAFGDNLEVFIKREDLTWNNKYFFIVEDNFKKSEEIAFEILEINQEKKRIYGSHINTLENPYKIFKKEHTIGSILDGVISNITTFGLFIALDGAPTDALIPLRFIPKEKSVNLKNFFKNGEKLRVSIKFIDVQNEKITMSLVDATEKISIEKVKKYVIKEVDMREETFSPFANLKKQLFETKS